MEHVMVDIETLGTATNAPIIAIGACEFDPYTGDIGAKFKRNIDWGSALKGRPVDADTLKWWFARDKAARDSAMLPGILLPSALISFRDWLDPAEKISRRIWGNGATFDIVLLEHAYHQCGLNVPWDYWNARDVRTICELASPAIDKKDFPFEGIKHDCLDDAAHQAKYVSTMWQHLRRADHA